MRSVHKRKPYLRNESQIAEIRAKISRDISSHVAEDQQIRGLQSMPLDPDAQNRLGIELVDWACQPTSYFVEKFPITKRINPYRFFKTKETNEFFGECVQISNSVCMLNIKEATVIGLVPAQLTLAMLPVQDGDYRAWIIEKVSKQVHEYFKANEEFKLPWVEQLIDIRKERDGNKQLSAAPVSNQLP
jgi:hypothetical protein